MHNNKLLPCPFCGGEVRTYQSRYKKNGVEGRNWFAICNNCKINYPATLDKIAKTEDEAIKLWNTRKPMEQIIEQLEKRCASFDCRLCRHYGDGTGMCNEDCTDAFVQDMFDIIKKEGVYSE